MRLKLRRSTLLMVGLSGLGALAAYGCDDGSSGHGGGHSSSSTVPSVGGGNGTGGQTSTSTEPSLPKGVCLSDKDCSADGKVCDAARLICVDCVQNLDCGDAGTCTGYACVTPQTCKSSKECTAMVCHSTLGICVDCETQKDCDTGKQCIDNTCRAGCTADTDCSGATPVCNLAKGFCAACSTDANCKEGETCTPAGACAARTCTPNLAGCFHDNVLTCDARGTGYTAQACSGGATCTETGGAHCGSDDGGSSSEGGSVGLNGDPCTSIPAFTGTQTVDGDGAEFANIPGKAYTVASSGWVNPADKQNATSRAIVRAAWSTDALHVHVHVDDPTIITSSSQEWNGDNVQIFVAGDAPTTGAVDGVKDGAANQIFFVPPTSGQAASSRAVNDGAQFEGASRVVDGGYEVELKWSWKGIATPVAAGKKIGFDVIVGVQDFPQSGGREFEYAIFKAIGVDGGGCDNGGVYCDDRLWCTPTLQ